MKKGFLKALLVLCFALVGIGVNYAATATIVSATASAIVGAQTAALSFDKNTGTRWESPASDPQWIYWDLGSSQALTSIAIEWEVAQAKTYQIQGSADASAWTTLATVNNTSTADHNIITTAISGSYRYVRMYGTARTTGYGYSIWEVTISTGTVASSSVASSVASAGSLLTINSATASAIVGAQTAALSCDKNTGTRWESPASDPQWIYWDLGSSKPLSSIIIDWEAAAASNYTIQGSTDAATWTILATVVNSKYMIDHTVITNNISGTYRYVKMNGTTRTTPYGYSIWEVSIYGGSGTSSTPATSSSSSAIVSSSKSSTPSSSSVKTTSSSVITSSSIGSSGVATVVAAVASTVAGANTAAMSFDGSTGTRWESAQGVDPQWIYWDLGSPQTVNKIMINWEVASASNYQIQGSDDASAWTTLATVLNSSIADQNKVTTSISGTYRYIRMYGTSRTTAWGYSIWEVTIYTGASSSSSSSSVSSVSSLPALPSVNANMQMTFQISNSTGGKWANNQIYITAQVRRPDGQFCYLAPDGSLNLCVSGDNTSNHSYLVSDYPTWQFPTNMSSGRLYVSYGSPLSCPFLGTAPNVGIAYPNIENQTDPNIPINFDWIEFAVGNNAIWVNTTQVDILGAPLKLALYTGSGNSYSLFNEVGITNSWQSITTAWSNQMDSTWKSLCQSNRLVAPIHGGPGFTNYWDACVNSAWTLYKTSPFAITMPQGVCTGYVQSDNRLRFNKPNDPTNYYVAKPTNNNDIWGGLGTLANWSPENQNTPAGSLELALEAQICAAFHRGIIANTAYWNSPSQFYTSGTYDPWSKFMHSISLSGGVVGNRAYGFCYDDVNDFSSTMSCVSPRALVMTLYWK